MMKMMVQKNIFHANGNKNVRVTISISDKIYLKTKIITKDQEGHYMMIQNQPIKKIKQL